MDRFIFYTNPTLTLACRPSGAPALFSLDAVAVLTGVHPKMLQYYCRSGLLGFHYDTLKDEPSFDENGLQEVRRIEHYRRHLGVGRQALPLICELWREGERLQIELGFLRTPDPQ